MGFGQEFVIFALDNLVALFVYFIFFPNASVRSGRLFHAGKKHKSLLMYCVLKI